MECCIYLIEHLHFMEHQHCITGAFSSSILSALQWFHPRYLEFHHYLELLISEMYISGTPHVKIHVTFWHHCNNISQLVDEYLWNYFYDIDDISTVYLRHDIFILYLPQHLTISPTTALQRDHLQRHLHQKLDVDALCNTLLLFHLQNKLLH